MKTRSRRLAFKASMDHLEDRRVLSASALGNAWPDPTHLSLSFAPDGTGDAGQSSALFQTMNTAGTTSAWQGAIVRAYQTWAAGANLSIGVKADGGQPLGTAGATEGDSRFGDIRIGAISQAPGVLAVTQPFSYTGGTWAGDVNFNTADVISLDGRAGSVDLYTLALHEAGHSLGLADNADTTSAMYDGYSGPRTGLAASDISAIQSIYGARPAGTTGNVSPSNPSWISPARPDRSDYNASGVLVSDSIAPGSSQHNYAFEPKSSGTYSIDVKTAGFSSLLARVTAYSGEASQFLASATATDPTGGDLVLTLPNLQAGNSYKFTIQGATSDVFGVGNYSVRVLPAGLSPTTVATGDVTVNGFVNPDNNTNDSVYTAKSLASIPGTTGYQRLGSLTATDPADYFRFAAPGSGPKVLTIVASALDSTMLSPSVTVYDSSGNPVASQVIRNQAGSYVVQVPGISYYATYIVGIAANDSQPGGTTGNYSVAVAFASTSEADAQVQLGAGRFAATTSGSTVSWGSASDLTLTTGLNGIVHLNLATDTGGVSQATSVVVTIKDAGGNVVRTMTAKANRSQSLELWLARGTFTISVAAVGSGSSSPAPINWSLSSRQLSDPMMSYGYVCVTSSTTTYPVGQTAPPPPPPLL